MRMLQNMEIVNLDGERVGSDGAWCLEQEHPRVGLRTRPRGIGRAVPHRGQQGGSPGQRGCFGVCRAIVLLMTGLAGACGSGPSAPTGSPPVQAGGVWRGDLRVTGGSGEACVGAAFQSAAGVAFDYTLRVQQSGAQLTATSMSPATGIVCQLAGSASTSSISLTLTTCSNTSPPRFFSCAGNILRDARPSGLTVSAEVSGNSLAGSYAETYDVFDYGTSTKLGTATSQAQVILNKQ